MEALLMMLRWFDFSLWFSPTTGAPATPGGSEWAKTAEYLPGFPPPTGP